MAADARLSRGGAAPRAARGARAVLALAAVLALLGVAWPLWAPWLGPKAPLLPATALPLLLALTVALCLGVMALEASAGLGARALALLGALVALNSVLRFVEVALPGPGGFTPVFALVIVCGYAWGARMGFLAGALTLGVSALVTGGVGPWLPYQMLGAGLVGLSAGLLPGARRSTSAPPRRREIVALAGFGALWGLGYGLLMSLWAWPILEAGQPPSPEPALARFLAFYLASSLWWDAFRAAGNAALLLAAGGGALVALRRLGRWLPLERPSDDDARGGAGRSPAGPRDPAAPTEQERWETAAAASVSAEEHALTAAEVSLPPPPALHPRAWALWLLGAAALSALTRNPLVLALCFLGVELVRAAVERPGPQPGRPGPASPSLPVARLAVALLLVSGLYSMALQHAGATVLFRLPAGWPLIGGPWTLESLVFGLSTGGMLVVLLAAFAAFQAALSRRQQLGLAPRAFAPAALSAGVALAWIPAARDELSALREARALRGLQGRGPRAWAALALPLLEGSLERAMGLAESLVARGLVPRGPAPLPRAAIAGGGLLAAGAILALGLGAPPAPGLGLLAAAAALLALGLVRTGGPAPRGSRRPLPWRARETLVALTALAPLALVALRPEARAALGYSPYPKLTLPSLDPWLLLALLGLALPALAILRAWQGTGSRFAGAKADSGGAPEGAERGLAMTGARGDTADALSRDAARAMSGEAAPTDLAGSHEADRARSTSGSVVRFEGFGFAYPGAAPVLRDVDLVLPGGTITLLAGPSGAGKSTLLRAAAGLAPSFTGGRATGRVRLGALDVTARGPEGLGGRVGFVAGRPEAGFVAERVADELAYGLEARGWPPRAIAARVASCLALVGLSGLGERRLDTLSGGERQRVAIAAALAGAPDVLLLDEPSSQLDDHAAEALLSALDRLRARGVTILLAEHRLRRVLPYADRLLWLPTTGGAPEEVSREELQRRRAPLGSPRRAAPASVPTRATAMDAAPFLVCEALRVARGDRVLLDSVDLEIRRGEIVALLGPSGAGKTSLLRTILGLLPAAGGRLRLDGRPLDALSREERFRLLGYLPQDAGEILLAQRVREEIALGLPPRVAASDEGRDAAKDMARDATSPVDELLDELGLRDLAERHPRDLSLGERQRVALAAVLARRPRVLLLDEPSRGLDDQALAALLTRVHDLAAKGAAVLVATHDERVAAAADRLVALPAPRRASA